MTCSQCGKPLTYCGDKWTHPMGAGCGKRRKRKKVKLFYIAPGFHVTKSEED